MGTNYFLCGCPEDAVEDVDFLFDMLYDCYGPYESMGGAKVFDAREQEVKNELQTYENLISYFFCIDKCITVC